jgi:formylglycine-generating enzyme required for sulfatase activity
VPEGEIILEGNVGTFAVEPFEISKYPVTWVQYRSFVEAKDGHQRKQWWHGLAEREDRPGKQYFQQDNRPAENVSWYDAVAFCRWLSARLGYKVRLPMEWQWQQAATGGNPANVYPWGKAWDSDRVNTNESGLRQTTAVGMYPQGASPVGALDMSGNVFEWCGNKHENPHYKDLSGGAHRVVRGGSWGDDEHLARASCRDHDDAGFRRDSHLGLRVVRGGSWPSYVRYARGSYHYHGVAGARNDRPGPAGGAVVPQSFLIRTRTHYIRR